VIGARAERRTPAAGEVVLEVDSVGVRYGALKAVDEVSFEIEAGGIVGLMGPNGAGKSTLLAALAGITRPTSGSIRLFGQDVTRRSVASICRMGMCVTHQTPRPFEEATVRENAEVASMFGSGNHSSERIDRVLAACDLAEHADTRAAELGPSSLRRLELARALATDPRILLLDEVGAGMPSDEVEELAGLLRRIRESGGTIILVEHVMDLLLNVAERLIVLDQGRLLADGEPTEVLSDGRVSVAYFGEELS